MKGFRQFILRGNLVDLAVAVVIGQQFSALVKGFSDSFVSPLLALFGGAPDLNHYKFSVRNHVFAYGAFLTDVISFLITAAVVYFLVVLPVAKLLRLFARDQAATERPCPVCTRKIPVAAQRCPECTSMLTQDTSGDVPAPRPVVG
jgi:large conductance mechanosensitive channel